MAENINEKALKLRMKLLCFLSMSIQILGLVLVAGGVVWFMMFVCGPITRELEPMADAKHILYGASRFSFDFVFVGLAAVILAQLARYVFDRQYKPGLMLRCGDKILYTFAALGILWALFRYAFLTYTVEDLSSRILFTHLLILPTAVKVLILIGLGLILKKIIPIIEEYKSLV